MSHVTEAARAAATESDVYFGGALHVAVREAQLARRVLMLALYDDEAGGAGRGPAAAAAVGRGAAPATWTSREVLEALRACRSGIIAIRVDAGSQNGRFFFDEFGVAAMGGARNSDDAVRLGLLPAVVFLSPDGAVVNVLHDQSEAALIRRIRALEGYCERAARAQGAEALAALQAARQAAGDTDGVAVAASPLSTAAATASSSPSAAETAVAGDESVPRDPELEAQGMPSVVVGGRRLYPTLRVSDVSLTPAQRQALFNVQLSWKRAALAERKARGPIAIEHERRAQAAEEAHRAEEARRAGAHEIATSTEARAAAAAAAEKKRQAHAAAAAAVTTASSSQSARATAAARKPPVTTATTAQGAPPSTSASAAAAAPAAAATAAATTTAPAAAAPAPFVPDMSSAKLNVRRVSTGETMRGLSFPAEATLGDVFARIGARRVRTQGHPSRVLRAPEDTSRTLLELGLVPSASLTIEEDAAITAAGATSTTDAPASGGGGWFGGLFGLLSAINPFGAPSTPAPTAASQQERPLVSSTATASASSSVSSSASSSRPATSTTQRRGNVHSLVTPAASSASSQKRERYNNGNSTMFGGDDDDEDGESESAPTAAAARK